MFRMCAVKRICIYLKDFDIKTEVIFCFSVQSWVSANDVCSSIGARLPVLMKKDDIQLLMNGMNTFVTYIGLKKV